MSKAVFLSLLRYGCMPFFIALIIFYLCCLIPVEDVPEGIDFIIPFDKLGHFMMFMGLSGATAFNYIYGRKGLNNSLFVLIVIVLPVLYGGLIEILQYLYFPPREGDWLDFLADTLGVFASLPFAYYFRKWCIKKKENI